MKSSPRIFLLILHILIRLDDLDVKPAVSYLDKAEDIPAPHILSLMEICPIHHSFNIYRRDLMGCLHAVTLQYCSKFILQGKRTLGHESLHGEHRNRLFDKHDGPPLLATERIVPHIILVRTIRVYMAKSGTNFMNSNKHWNGHVLKF